MPKLTHAQRDIIEHQLRAEIVRLRDVNQTYEALAVADRTEVRQLRAQRDALQAQLDERGVITARAAAMKRARAMALQLGKTVRVLPNNTVEVCG